MVGLLRVVYGWLLLGSEHSPGCRKVRLRLLLVMGSAPYVLTWLQEGQVITRLTFRRFKSGASPVEGQV